jgi:DNA repair protein RecO (recombination protein O)
MTNHCKATGFIFRKEDRSETDRIFFVFTEEFGKLKIFAKSIRKIGSKLKSGADVFAISEMEFIQGKAKKTLTDSVFIKKFNNVVESPKRFLIAQKISRVLEDFLNGEDRDIKIFDLLEKTFDNLNSVSIKKENCDLVYYYFLWNFFSLSGFLPELEKCPECNFKLNPDEVYFSYEAGGVICRKCFNKNNKAQKINSDVVKILRMFLKNDWQTLLRLKISFLSKKMLEEISSGYYLYLLEK